MKTSVAMKLFLVVFVSMLMVVPMLSVDNGISAGTSNAHSVLDRVNTDTNNKSSTVFPTHANLSMPKINTPYTSLFEKLDNIPYNFSPQNLSSGGKLYKVTFNEHNLTSGMPWKVKIVENSQGPQRELGPISLLYGCLYGINPAQAVKVTTNTSVSIFLQNGSYCYLAGPNNTYTDINRFHVNGTVQNINISFPKFYKVTIKENNLASGISWNSIAVPEDFSPQFFSFYYNITSSKDMMIAYLPNGSYDLLSGPQSTYISQSPVIVNGANTNVTVTFPELYKITFKETGLHTGFRWAILSQECNNAFLPTLYANSSYSTSMIGYLPEGKYIYFDSYNIFSDQDNMSAILSILYSEEYTNFDKFTITNNSLTVSIIFPTVYAITLLATNVPTGADWIINLHNKNNSIGAENYSYSDIMTAYLPNGTYYYTPCIDQVSLTGGNFTVNGTSQTVNVTFPAMYKVTFTKTNVPAGLSWSINLHNKNYSIYYSNSTSSTSMTAYLPNGTYYYTPCIGQVSLTGGNFTVNGTTQTINVTFPVIYKVTFTETNVPAGVSWSINLNNNSISYSNSTSSTSMTAYLPNGTYYYTANYYYYNNGYMSISVPSHEFTVNGTTQTINVKFPTTYKVTFTETNVPAGVSWSINLHNKNYSIYYSNSTSSTSMTAYLPNGTYYYSPSLDQISYPSGNFTVAGASANISIAFHIMYKVTFTETNVPVGVSWSINLYTANNSTYYYSTSSPSMTAYLPNGTYYYTANYYYNNGYMSISVPSREFTVNGTSQTINVTFPVTYKVTFTETGLSSGTTWSVTLNGTTLSSTTNTIIFSMPNGTYSYTVSSVSGYTLSSSSGNITVKGSNYTQSIIFKPVKVTVSKYNVTFTETGLSSGTTWSVTLNGTTLSSTTSTIGFTGITNGTFLYTVSTSNKTYKPSLYSGSITVSGKDISKSVTFTKVKYTVTFRETGLSSGTTWYVNLTNGMSSGPITSSSYSFSLTNGTYSYTPSHINNYYVVNGTFIVNGVSQNISVNYLKYAHLSISVTPSSALISINGCNITLTNGNFSEYLMQGYYYITVTNSSYKPYTNLVYLSLNKTYSYNISLTPITVYGYLTGTVLPGNATITANGVGIPVMNGYFNVSLAPGTYYITVTAPGYNGNISVEKITKNSVTPLTVTLSKLKPAVKSITVSGYISNINASVTVNGISAYVNSTGYYSISVSSGNVVISAYESGYYPYSRTVDLTTSQAINITLVREPAATTTVTVNGTVSSGYNVTVTNLTTHNGYISMDYNATVNGIVTVLLPYNQIRNATIADILSSKVYIDGKSYTDFTITITSSGSAILTVYNLAGDPALYWKYSPAASLPQYYNVTFTETGLKSGTSWAVTMYGTTLSSTTSTITFSMPNGTYSYTVSSVSGYTLSPSSGNITVHGSNTPKSITFTHNTSKKTPFTLSPLELYAIIGAVVAIAAIGGAFMFIRRRR